MSCMITVVECALCDSFGDAELLRGLTSQPVMHLPPRWEWAPIENRRCLFEHVCGTCADRIAEEKA